MKREKATMVTIQKGKRRGKSPLFFQCNQKDHYQLNIKSMLMLRLYFSIKGESIFPFINSSHITKK